MKHILEYRYIHTSKKRTHSTHTHTHTPKVVLEYPTDHAQACQLASDLVTHQQSINQCVAQHFETTTPH